MKIGKSAKEMGAKSTSTIASMGTTTSKTTSKLPDLCGVRQIGNEVIFVTRCPDANTVQIAGEFNNWQPDRSKMQKIGSEGLWQFKMRLAPGTYRYRLVVDGKWQQDPFNNNAEPNPYGELNSVVTVK